MRRSSSLRAAAVLSTGVLAIFASVNDRMRVMTAERLTALTGPDGMLHSVAQLPEAARERLRQIDEQLPMLLHRHHLLRAAVLSIYIGVAALVASVITLAVAVPANSEAYRLLVVGTGARRDCCHPGRLPLRGCFDHDVQGRDRLRGEAFALARLVTQGHSTPG